MWHSRIEFFDRLVPVIRWFMPLAYAIVRCWYVLRRPARSTAAVAVLHENRILLVSHSYKDGYSLPGGVMQLHEEPECGAVRELFEETGIAIEPIALRLVDVSTCESPYGERKMHLFEVRIFGDPPPIRINGWETTTGLFVDAREFRGHDI